MPRKQPKLPPSASTTSSESCQGLFTTKKRSIKTLIWRLNTKETKQVSKVKTRTFAGYLLPPNSLNKKTVVLDLDQTLIHSTSYLKPDIPPRRNCDFRLMLRGRRVLFVKKRPFVDKFLEYLNLNNFEVVIFTAGTRGYASPLLDKLDPKGFISHRLYRDSCVVFNGEYYIKDLSCLGRDLNNVVIVDDRPVSYILQPENGIHIKPFIYDLLDDELKKLMDNFFNTCNNYNDLKDAVKHYQVRQAKKYRMLWTQELHYKFVVAVKHLGIQNAVPKKVLELMNVPGLRMDSVASHLEKYRKNLEMLSTNMQQRFTKQSSITQNSGDAYSQVFEDDSFISTQLITGAQQCFTEQDSSSQVPIGANNPVMENNDLFIRNSPITELQQNFTVQDSSTQVPSGAYHPVTEEDWQKDWFVGSPPITDVKLQTLQQFIFSLYCLVQWMFFYLGSCL